MRYAATKWLVGCAVTLSLAGCASARTGDAMKDRPTLLRDDVTMLATTIGERNVDAHADALERAAAWIESRLAAVGTVVREPYPCGTSSVRNVYVDVCGATKPDEIVVVGAHYDSVRGSPGANDNGSAVAAMLLLADAFAKQARDGHPQERTIRFVAFANEEPPYFQTAAMGSLVHAQACKVRGERITAMIAIETIGCFSDEPDSQHYPPGVPLALPTVGNFIGVVSDLERKPMGERVAAAMRGTGEAAMKVPVQAAALPAQMPGVGWSDHWSFWQVGFAAVMITDTAPFRYAHYHRATDTPDRIDYVRMSDVVNGIERAIADLANGPAR